jgi:acyl-coenzyme A synthetase/AMP-(fatty) acid ligase
MAGVDAPVLRDAIANAASPRFFWDRAAVARFTDLDRATSLGGRRADLAGRAVLVATASQLTTALALIELDGVARRLLILPPDANTEHLDALMEAASIDAVVVDRGTNADRSFDRVVQVMGAASIEPADEKWPPRIQTEWALMTSGTTGVPKLVAHDLEGLTAAIRTPSPADGADVWGTFYDIRRYGGLQIYLRAVCGGASLVLSNAGEAIADHVARLVEHGVTHVSGTPSQWRRALMVPAIRNLALRYVRLSGEIADQAVLDSLRAAFPAAIVGHAYASTEAGVVFDVNDGLAGFPAAFVGAHHDGIELKIADGMLQVRSRGVASGYVGGGQALVDTAGFVDTGDIVERRGDRYHFAGRKGGIINVGGLKIHPEEIEAVINRHPQVRMSLVRPKQSPITGAVVVADVVLKSEGEGARKIELKDDILKFCREMLPRHKVPAAISFVPALKVAASGKLMRR